MPTTTVVGAGPTVKVNGAALRPEIMSRLIDLRAELSIGAASRLQMRFDLFDSWSTSIKIGDAFELEMDDGAGTSSTVLTGEITALALEAEVGAAELVVTGYDRLHRLGNDVVAQTYVNKSYGDVIREIVQRRGLTANVHSSLDSPRFPHLIQATTDLAFLDEIARRAGMECSIDRTEVRVRPRTSGSTVQLKLGDDGELRSFHARFTATERPTDVMTRGWDPASKTSVVASGTSELSETLHDVPIASGAAQHPFGSRSANVWRGTVGSVAEGESLAKGIARRMTSSELTGRGTTWGTPNLVPGCLAQIAGVDPSWNGSYYVTAVEHVYNDEDTYLTRFTVGGLDGGGLVDLIGSPASHGALDVLATGVTIGIVTDNKDTEHKHGHVKVKLPYLGVDRQTQEIQSAWARVATIGAGNQRGVMFMPEINDEVLVAFEHGDIRRPYVIGTLWNGLDAPPLDVADADTKDKRIIVSRTGHRLTFFDGASDDKSNVTIVLADGTTKLHLGKDKVELISNNKPIEVKHSNGSILLKDNGDIVLTGANITLKATQNIELDGANVKIKAKTATEVAAGTTLDLKGQASAKLQASGITEVKGSLLKLN